MAAGPHEPPRRGLAAGASVAFLLLLVLVVWSPWPNTVDAPPASTTDAQDTPEPRADAPPSAPPPQDRGAPRTEAAQEDTAGGNDGDPFEAPFDLLVLRDSDGQPVAGASVVFAADPMPAAPDALVPLRIHGIEVTDAHGLARGARSRAWSYVWCRVEIGGVPHVGQARVTRYMGFRPQPLTLWLHPDRGGLELRVVDPDGRPAPGTTVQWALTAPQPDGTEARESGLVADGRTTGTDGRLAWAAYGRIRRAFEERAGAGAALGLRASYPDGPPLLVRIDDPAPAPGSRTVLELESARRLELRIADAAGTPLCGEFEVGLQPGPSGLGLGPGLRAVPALDGVAVLAGLGEAELPKDDLWTAILPEAAFRAEFHGPSRGGPATVVAAVRLPRSIHVVRGRLLDAAGEAVPRFDVEVVCETFVDDALPSVTSTYVARTGPDGSFCVLVPAAPGGRPRTAAGGQEGGRILLVPRDPAWQDARSPGQPARDLRTDLTARWPFDPGEAPRSGPSTDLGDVVLPLPRQLGHATSGETDRRPSGR